MWHGSGKVEGGMLVGLSRPSGLMVAHVSEEHAPRRIRNVGRKVKAPWRNVRDGARGRRQVVGKRGDGRDAVRLDALTAGILCQAQKRGQLSDAINRGWPDEEPKDGAAQPPRLDQVDGIASALSQGSR